jgi:PAS domain S-box-containing protein
MDKPLRVLHLEDDPDFIALVSALLEREGMAPELVSVADFENYVTALKEHSFDIILADYQLPSCNGIQALQAARENCPDVPFLLISGTIGEQVAIESLHCGATDYVLKDRIERLEPAVRRAIQEAREKTQRKRAEIELIRREKYFRTLTENSVDVLTILGREGNFQYNSSSLKSLLGYDPKEVAGQIAFDFVHPEDVQGVKRAFEQALKNPDLRVTHEFRLRHRDGSWRSIESICQNRLNDPEIAGVVINSRDISDRKKAEAEMRESEQQYRLIFDGNPVPMWVSDVDTCAFLEVNEAAVQNYGFSREEFLGMNTNSIRPPDEVPKMAKYFTEVLRRRTKGGIGHAGLWRHLKKDGTQIDAEITWSIIMFKGREALLTMANDVTDRKRAAEALEKSEASLAAAQRIAHLGSWEMDLVHEDVSANELRWSDETYRIFGLEPRQVQVTNEIFFQRVHPADRQRVYEAVKGAFQQHKSYDLEHRILLANGDERVLRQRAEFALDAAGKPIQMRGIVMDITERKRLEEQLRQSQKLEAIGQLAGGVAHDFNNILTVIHGHASLLVHEQNVSPGVAKSARQITQAAERAARLTRQLLTFSRRQVIQPRRLEMNELVSNLTMMLGRILGEDIALQLNYLPEKVFVLADSSMIEQVLLNLAVNARDAMPRGGHLAIRISVVNIGAAHLVYHPEASIGKFVCLSAIDNGCGIAPENLRRIFEPFFTTKEVGKGTGLGLATVYGVVKQHQGWIEVESELGKGATFRVYLPLSEDNYLEIEQQPAEPVVRGGKETILVVEDEGPVRELVCSLLTAYGYRVLPAQSGVEALKVWEQSPQKADLLLTDVVMPDRLNGRELAAKLQAECPRLKVIFTSGYSTDVVGKDFVLQRELHYLQKPYEPRKLALTVRNCLDS